MCARTHTHTHKHTHIHTHTQHVDSCGLPLLSEEDSDERLGVKRIKEALQAHMWPDMTLKPRHEPAQLAANAKPQDPLPDADQGEPSQGSEHSSTETSTALTGTDMTKCTYCISQVVPLSVCPVCDRPLLCPSTLELVVGCLFCAFPCRHLAAR